MMFKVKVMTPLKENDMLVKCKKGIGAIRITKEELIMNNAVLIGITGGTGSGKSTIADELYSSFSQMNVLL